jgi:hypothetical protein
MKNMFVANYNEKNRSYKFDRLERFIKAQIDNSIELGWEKDNVIFMANFQYEYKGISSYVINLNDFCFTGTKMFAINEAYNQDLVNDIVWLHDIDAWQNVAFNFPYFKDVGIATYSSSRFNGGSIFLKPQAKDIVQQVVDTIIVEKSNKEEPILNRILKSSEYKERVTVLNNTFNVGCSGFVTRYERSLKPIRVCHFHPDNRIAWDTHALDRNKLGKKCISNRLEKLLRKHFDNLAK